MPSSVRTSPRELGAVAEARQDQNLGRSSLAVPPRHTLLLPGRLRAGQRETPVHVTPRRLSAGLARGQPEQG